MLEIKNEGEAPLGWLDRPWRELIRLSWPITVSMLSYSVMTLADTLFVGRLGAAPLAGVGLAGMAAFTLICFPMGLLRGVKVLVSQAHGAGNHQKERAYLGGALVSALVLSVVIVIVGLVVVELLPRASDSVEAGIVASKYLGIRLLGTPMVLCYVALRETRYGRGDPRSPMIASVVGNLLNVGLDWLFIFGLEMGAPGAAWATVIAQSVECALLVVVVSPNGFGFKQLRPQHLKELLSVGIPTATQFLLEVLSMSIVIAMLAGYSDLEMASHQIAIQMIHFSFLPCLAVGEAAGIMSGQAVGAGRYNLVRDIARRGVTITLSYGLIGMTTFLLFRHGLVALFTEEPALLHRSAQLLLVASIFQLFDAALIVAFGTLRGTGDVRIPALIGIGCAWAFTPTLTWYLGIHLGHGALGAWIGLCCEIVAIASLLWWRLLSGGWRKAAERQRRSAAE